MVIRKVSAEEAATWPKTHSVGNKGIRAKTRAEYDALIAEYEVGDGAEFTLNEGENKFTVKNHVVAAAKRRNMVATVLRGKSNTVKVRFDPEGTVKPKRERKVKAE